MLMTVLAAVLLAACGDRSKPDDASASPTEVEEERTYPFRITATTGMVADTVRQVAGERGTVVAIIGEGVDPHLYVPTRSDVAALMEADIVFYSGLLLEGKMTDTLIKVAGRRPVHAVTELVDESLLLQPEDFAGHFDPHLWMDVSGWTHAVTAVTEALAAFDPDGADGYRERAAAYTATLGELHDYALQALGSIPEQQRMLVTAHDAFNYFGHAYGLDVAGIQGISTESEAGLDRINRLVDLLVTRRIAAVFVETTIADRNVRALIEGAAARGHTVVVGGELFSDAMGQPGTYEGTYVGMLDHNITTVARALGGDAPELGFQRRLSHAATGP
ncbi:MAG: zinc ABC transporter substrate-binding protein [Spirochaetaceae bacterium]|nr:zinc ABC transporter substrate-binding protein [Spirochaetaceae bacterium]